MAYSTPLEQVVAEEIGHPAHGNAAKGGGQPSALNRWLLSLFGAGFLLYMSDYITMRLPYTQRYRELSLEHLVCRFCGHSVELLGAWKCECGYKRPGNYFGRCPKCLGHPHYIDCPSCGFTMDVR